MWYCSDSIIYVTGQAYGKDQYSINIEAYTEVTRCLEAFQISNYLSFCAFSYSHLYPSI